MDITALIMHAHLIFVGVLLGSMQSNMEVYCMVTSTTETGLNTTESQDIEHSGATENLTDSPLHVSSQGSVFSTQLSTKSHDPPYSITATFKVPSSFTQTDNLKSSPTTTYMSSAPITNMTVSTSSTMASSMTSASTLTLSPLTPPLLSTQSSSVTRSLGFTTTSVKSSKTTMDPNFWWPGMTGTPPEWVRQILSNPPVLDSENPQPCIEPDNHPTPPPGFNPKTDMGYGVNCIHLFFNYFPCGTQEELLCLCEKICEEEEQEEFIEEFENNQSALAPKYNDKISDGFRIAVLTIVMVLGIFGNAVVIITIALFMGKQTVTNVYICNLAVADLIVVSVCVPLKIVDAANGHNWTVGDAMCRIMVWLYFYSFMSSVFTLTAMSIERFLVICYPVSSRMISSMKRTQFIIAFIWVLSAGLASPVFYIFSAYQYGPTEDSKVCSVNNFEDGYGQRLGFYLYVFIVIFLCPCVVMSFAYIKTCISLWESIKKQRELKNLHVKQSSVKSESESKRKRPPKSTSGGRFQVIKVLILVLVVFCVCWFPYLFTQVVIFAQTRVGSFAIYNYYELEFSRWFNVLSLANSCVNPILYGLLSRRYREGFIRCFKCDRQSVNRPNSSVRTASSSIGNGGSIHRRTSSQYSQQSSVKSVSVMEPLPESKEESVLVKNNHLGLYTLSQTLYKDKNDKENTGISNAAFVVHDDEISSISNENSTMYEKEDSSNNENGFENKGFEIEDEDAQSSQNVSIDGKGVISDGNNPDNSKYTPDEDKHSSNKIIFDNKNTVTDLTPNDSILSDGKHIESKNILGDNEIYGVNHNDETSSGYNESLSNLTSDDTNTNCDESHHSDSISNETSKTHDSNNMISNFVYGNANRDSNDIHVPSVSIAENSLTSDITVQATGNHVDDITGNIKPLNNLIPQQKIPKIHEHRITMSAYESEA